MFGLLITTVYLNLKLIGLSVALNVFLYFLGTILICYANVCGRAHLVPDQATQSYGKSRIHNMERNGFLIACIQHNHLIPGLNFFFPGKQLKIV